MSDNRYYVKFALWADGRSFGWRLVDGPRIVRLTSLVDELQTYSLVPGHATMELKSKLDSLADNIDVLCYFVERVGLRLVLLALAGIGLMKVLHIH
jgi:hypothetical protein